MWDPGLSDEEIMADACRRLFDPAWEEMLRYYQAAEKAMLDCKEPVGKWAFPSPTSVYTPRFESLIDSRMQRALEIARQSSDKKILARVENQHHFWDQAKGILAGLRAKRAP